MFPWRLLLPWMPPEYRALPTQACSVQFMHALILFRPPDRLQMWSYALFFEHFRGISPVRVAWRRVRVAAFNPVVVTFEGRSAPRVESVIRRLPISIIYSSDIRNHSSSCLDSITSPPSHRSPGSDGHLSSSGSVPSMQAAKTET